MKEKIKVYLADDHQMLIEGMKAVIKTNADFEVVGFSLNGVNLIDNAIEAKTDILVMDINMPEKDGLQVLKELSKSKMFFKVIILSSYDDLKLVREVIKLGAKGYLTIEIIPTASLTERELVIIKLIALEYSGKKISEKLFISTNTVETHRKNLLKKLKVKSSIGLVKYAIKNNLI